MGRDPILLGCCQQREAVDNFFSCCRAAGRSAATESAGRAGRIPCLKSKTETFILDEREMIKGSISD
jgi:hypothetical protein